MAKTSLHAFKAKDTRFVADWLKSQGLHKLVLYLKIFKNHLYYLWHVRVLSIKPCQEKMRSWSLDHVYIHSLRSIIKATEKFPGGGGIWSPGMDLWWGIWTAFRPREGGIWTKDFQNFKCPEGYPGGDVEASIWLVRNEITFDFISYLLSRNNLTMWSPINNTILNSLSLFSEMLFYRMVRYWFISSFGKIKRHNACETSPTFRGENSLFYCSHARYRTLACCVILRMFCLN